MSQANMKCGCEMLIADYSEDAPSWIKYCKLHAAAPQLVKTLKEIADIAAGKTVTVDNIFEIQEMAESAIAKAEASS